MTATMAAAKDTNQLTRAKASATRSAYNPTNHPNRRQQPFYQQHSAMKNTLPTTVTTSQTTMERAINIGFAGYTPAYLHQQQQQPPHHAGNGGGIMNERLQQQKQQRNNQVAGSSRIAACVDIAVVDDEEGNVDGNVNIVYEDGVASVAPLLTSVASPATGNVNFPVDRHTGVTSGGVLFDAVADAGNEDVDLHGVEEADDSDSFGSMETLSDNVAVWVDGEKHWVAGVDAGTTCADLIGALLNYQNAQLLHEKQQQQQRMRQHMFNVNIDSNKNNNHIANNNTATSINCLSTNNATTTTTTNTNTAINQSTLIKPSTNTKENCDPSLLAPRSAELTIGACLSSPPPPHPSHVAATAVTSSSLALTVPASSGFGGAVGLALCGNRLTAQHASEYVIVKQHRHCEEYLDGNAKVFDVLPTQDGTSRRECELLLRRLTATNNHSNSNRNATFTALPHPSILHRPTSPSLNLNTQVSSLLSTDKDSGMGSPVGSSRSARLRRRKYKSAATVSWLAQANTLHPRVSQRAVAAFSGLGNGLSNATTVGGANSKHIAVMDCGLGEDVVTTDALDGLAGDIEGGNGGGVSANERLLKIILAQDETIHRQLALLREKERQISKIEEEKHRVRERELGKNYLLETYLNGLDEANVEPDLEAGTDVVLADSPLNEFNDVRVDDTTTALVVVDYDDDDGDIDGIADGEGARVGADVEIDEQYERTAKTTKVHKPTRITTTRKDVLTTNKTRDFNSDARHSKKLKGDFTVGGVGERGFPSPSGKTETNEPPSASCQGNEQEIDTQLFWLEKIYALNKQLQREEELLVKLHAKVRKHQVKRAYQTKREVLQQIEKLDAELTLQCCDIRAVESKLHASNEQLKQKLGVLERLSQEFLTTMDAPLVGEGLAQQRDAAGELVVQCGSEMTDNRMPDVINNEDHNKLATTLLHATEYAMSEENLQGSAEIETQAMAEQLSMQESCQLQRQEDMWHLRVACMEAPQTDAHLNKINVELNEETGKKTAASTTTTTATPLLHATKLSASKLTASTCAPSSSTSSMLTTATTTNALGAPMDACIVSAPTTVEDKHNTLALQLLQSTRQQQQQQQQQVTQQEQMLLPQPPAEDDNRPQRVDADDELIVDALPATGGVQFPQSNYPISCINQAAIHATSKLATQHNIVAAATDGHGHGGVTCGATRERLNTPEQTRGGAAAYLTKTVLQQQEKQQQQQQLQLVAQQQQLTQQPQFLLQKQHFNYINASNSNNTNLNDKNLLPPSHVAHTKTLRKQMFGPKSLNQRPASASTAVAVAAAAAAEVQPATQKIIHASTATTTVMITPSTSMVTPNSVGVHGGCFSSSSILTSPLRPTTPNVLSATPVLSPPGVSTQCSSSGAGIDITQLGTLV